MGSRYDLPICNDDFLRGNNAARRGYLPYQKIPTVEAESPLFSSTTLRLVCACRCYIRSVETQMADGDGAAVRHVVFRTALGSESELEGVPQRKLHHSTRLGLAEWSLS